MVRHSVRFTPCTLTRLSLYLSHCLRLSRIRELRTHGTTTLKPRAAEFNAVGVAAVITTFVRTKQKMLYMALKLSHADAFPRRTTHIKPYRTESRMRR